MPKMVSRILATLIVPFIFLLLACQVPVDWRMARFYSFNAIAYLFNGYLVAQGQTFELSEHPGFPFIYFLALVVKVYGLFQASGSFSPGNFLDALEFVYSFSVFLCWGIIAISLFIFGWKLSGRYSLWVVLPLQYFFVSSTSFIKDISFLQPELLIVPLSIANCLVFYGYLSIWWTSPLTSSLILSRLNFLPNLLSLFLDYGLRRLTLLVALLLICGGLYFVRFQEGFTVMANTIWGALSVVRQVKGNEHEIYRLDLWDELRSNFSLLLIMLVTSIGVPLLALRTGTFPRKPVMVALAIIAVTYLQFLIRPVHFRYLYPAFFLLPVVFPYFLKILPLKRSIILAITYLLLGHSLYSQLEVLRQVKKDIAYGAREAAETDNRYFEKKQCLHLLNGGGRPESKLNLRLANAAAKHYFSPELSKRYPKVYFSLKTNGEYINFLDEKVQVEALPESCVVISGIENLDELQSYLPKKWKKFVWRPYGPETFIGIDPTG